MMTQVVGTKEQTIVVGLGEMKVTKDPSSILTCLGLGSCIGVSAYDPVAKVGGMAHIVLPSSEGRNVKRSAKYADMAISMLFEAMAEEGAHKVRTVIKLVGGAELSTAPGMDNAFKIGERNQEMVKLNLVKEGANWVAEDLGGNHGRTVRMYANSGRVVVSAAGFETKEL